MPSHKHTHFTPTNSQTSGHAPVLKVRTHVRVGSISANHNETLVRTPCPAAQLKVKTHLKAGGLHVNHHETLLLASRPVAVLRVKTHVKAGLLRDRPTIA